MNWPAPDWSQPWFSPFAGDGAAIRAACEHGLSLSLALTQRMRANSPRFVSQTELPDGVAYELFIFETDSVPTREGLHDFFNGLVWLSFPATKRLLNRLQATEIAKAGVIPLRGPVRDAVTLLDENAVLLQAPDALWTALLARDWRRLFVDLRPLWAQARLVLFGHALTEKLVTPYKAITGHVLRAAVPLAMGDDLSAWDTWLTAYLTSVHLTTKLFTPLPIAGIPGWWPGNQDPAFYDDNQVFRLSPTRRVVRSQLS